MSIRLRYIAAVFASLLAATPLSYAEGERKEATPERIAELIDQLGADDYFQREKAQAELAAMSFEAFDALSAAESHPDIEIAARDRGGGERIAAVRGDALALKRRPAQAGAVATDAGDGLHRGDVFPLRRHAAARCRRASSSRRPPVRSASRRH